MMKDAEWCFVAKMNGKEIVIPESELKKVDGSQGKFECDRMLLAGIAILAANGWLELKAPDPLTTLSET